MHDRMRRREFLRRVGGGAAAVGLGRVLSASAAEPAATTREGLTIRDLPRKKLGRTGFLAPPLSIGLAHMGHAFYPPDEFEAVTHAAIDAGLTYLDVAPLYDVSQERLGPVLAKRRKEVFLVSKTNDPTRDGTLRLIDKSLRAMRTDRLDVCHLHNVGQFPTERVLGKGGMLEGLQVAKDRKLVRFLGATGHQNVRRFLPVLETEQIDVLMIVLNFADRHTYNFEERIVPRAREKGVAVVAMKVLGGVPGGWAGYRERRPGAFAGRHYDMAMRYALGLPDVATMVLGIKSIEELRRAILAVRGYRPFSEAEKAEVLEEGRRLARERGEFHGPVGWDA